MASKGSKIDGPRNPAAKEYASLLYFLSQAYGFSDLRWFENDTAFFYGTRPDQLKTKWTLNSGNQVISHVGIFPFTAVVDRRPLKVGGIGSVATHPNFRKKGLMTRLMNHVGEQMVKEGYDLSILWGDRSRYGHFDYERGVFVDRFSFNRKALKPLPLGRNIRPVKPNDWHVIHKLFMKHPFYTQRHADYLKALHRRFDRGIPDPVWVMEKGGKVVAYVMVFKSNEGGYELAEWGGETKQVVDLLASVLPKPATGIVWASIYPGCELYQWALENHETQIKTTQTSMIKILNFGKVLKAFEPQLQKRYERHHLRNLGSVTFQLEDQEKVTLNFGKNLQVERGSKGGKAIQLTQSQGVRLLFGCGAPSEELQLKGFDVEMLDSLFPLQWYWWRSDWI